MTQKPDAVEPDRKELLRRIEDLKLRNHLLRDRVDLPDELYAKRMKWYDKAMQVDTLTTERDKYRDACERLIGHYGNQQTWGTTNPEYNEPDLYLKRDGMAFARQVEAEIKGESK